MQSAYDSYRREDKWCYTRTGRLQYDIEKLCGQSAGYEPVTYFLE